MSRALLPIVLGVLFLIGTILLLVKGSDRQQRRAEQVREAARIEETRRATRAEAARVENETRHLKETAQDVVEKLIEGSDSAVVALAQKNFPGIVREAAKRKREPFKSLAPPRRIRRDRRTKRMWSENFRASIITIASASPSAKAGDDEDTVIFKYRIW